MVVVARLFGRRMFHMWIFLVSYSLPVTNVSFGCLVPMVTRSWQEPSLLHVRGSVIYCSHPAT